LWGQITPLSRRDRRALFVHHHEGSVILEVHRGIMEEATPEALRQRIRDLETRIQGQAREIRALEKIEGMQERCRELEAENRSLREKLEELRTFWSLSKTLSTTLNLEELVRLALHVIGRSLHVDAYCLMLLEEGNDRLTVKAAFGLPEERVLGMTLRLGDGVSGLVAQTGQAMLVPDVSAEARFLEHSFFLHRRGSFICVPLRLGGGEVIGVLSAHKAEAQGFGVADLDLFQAVANQIAVPLGNAQLYQRTKELSSRDDLTGLFNRRYFFDQLEKEVQRARRYGRVFSLLMLDLDDFKRYNDTHGHLMGDELLRQVARLLLSTTRRADVVARYGGEEFVVLLPEINAQGAAVVAEKIRLGVEQYPFAGRSSQPGGAMTVTLGLATYPTDSEDGVELVEVADKALYAGKEAGGNRVQPAPGIPPASWETP
jgi:diguanylate cyclase (GGDEF)-like protein